MFQRDLGTRTGVQVSALGLGCWAIGGPYTSNGRPAGWGEVDDEESIRAIRRALELGVTLFDTADAYGLAAATASVCSVGPSPGGATTW